MHFSIQQTPHVAEARTLRWLGANTRLVHGKNTCLVQNKTIVIHSTDFGIENAAANSQIDVHLNYHHNAGRSAACVWKRHRATVFKYRNKL